jgi:hypothetical protein
MSQADLDINRGVRSILVKHWIDLGRLSVRNNDGKLYIRGALVRISGAGEDLTTPIVSAIFEEIGRIRDVRQVYPALENWSNDSGGWTPIGGAKTQQKTGQQTDIRGGAGVFDIAGKTGDQ